MDSLALALVIIAAMYFHYGNKKVDQLEELKICQSNLLESQTQLLDVLAKLDGYKHGDIDK